MKTICAWCKIFLRCDEDDDERVSHGICRQCMHLLSVPSLNNLSKHLDDIAVPVSAVIINQDNIKDLTTYWFNKSYKSTFPSKFQTLHMPPGELINCENAKSKEGCGQAPSCASCELRSAITDTYLTATPHFDIPAYTDNERKQPLFFVNTWKYENVVYLSIHTQH